MIVPEINPLQAFTPILDASTFDDESIKSEQASMKTQCFTIILWDMFLTLKSSLLPSQR